MKIFVLATFAVALLFVSKPTKAQTDQISAGIAAGSAIADALAEVDFAEVLTDLVGSLSSFLGVLGPVADLIMAFIPGGESEDMTYMIEQFAAVNNQLSAMSQQFQDLANQIDWSVMQNLYGADENRIKNMLLELDEFLTAPNADAADDEKTTFIMNYESSFQNAAQNLYLALTRQDSVFTPNLIDAACTNLANNRKDVQVFMMGMIQLLIEGAEIEIMYYKLKDDLNESNQQNIWNQRIEEVKQKMAETDTALTNIWSTQSKTDIEKYTSEHYNEDRQTFTNGLQQYLTDKFYWRYWDVVAYDSTEQSNTNDNYGMTCDFITYKYEDYSMNVIVSSRDLTQQRTLSTSDVQSIISFLEDHWQGWTISYWNTVWAKNIFQSIDASKTSCTGSYNFIGVFKSGLDVKIAGSNSHKENLTFKKIAQSRTYTFVFFA